MANSTQNFKLIKPLQEEFYNVDDFNKNADAVDAALAALDIKKAPSGFGLGTAAIDISGQDLNADRATGFYRGINLANAPSQGWWYVINMSHSDTNWYYQQAVSYGAGNTPSIIFTRTKISGVWSAWKQLATIDGTIANADTVDGKHASAFAPSGFGLGQDLQANGAWNVTDANLATGTGFYYVSTSANMPSGLSDGQIICVSYSPKWKHQYCFEFGPAYSGKSYTRVLNNGTWSAWRQIATTDQLPNPHRLYRGGSDGEDAMDYYVAPHWMTGDSWRLSAYNTVKDEQNGIHRVSVDVADFAVTLSSNGASNGSPMKFQWSGKDGQPTWLWGGNDGINMYVYDPSKFNVSTAKNINNQGTVTLASPTESNQIDITQPSYSQGNPVKLLNFHWYNDTYSLGAIRSPSKQIAGLGIYLNGVQKAYWDSAGDYRHGGGIYCDHYMVNTSGNTGLLGGEGDTGNPVGDQKANLRISSWFSTGFFDSCTGNGYTVGINHRNGDITSKGKVTASTLYTGNWFRSTGDTGWCNETYNGGWYMSDATWIRAYNGKNVYTKGVFQADGGFNGALHGTADYATLMTPLSGNAGFKLGYTADGQVTNKGEWGRVVMRYDTNGQTYGVRVDRSDNADMVAGLAVSGGRNNVGNQVVRTDENGYLQAGYMNSSNGDEGNNSNPARVWGTNGSDSYLRTYLTSALSVNYANTAGNANAVNGHVFNWSGKDGQPTWLWGGNDAGNMYVYNPSNFNVNSVGGYTAAQLMANSGGIVAQSWGANGYVKFSGGFIMQWGEAKSYSDNAFPIAFPSAVVQIVITGSVGWSFIDRTKFHLDDPNISDSGKPATRTYVAFGY